MLNSHFRESDVSSLISPFCFKCKKAFSDGETVEIKTIGRLAISEGSMGTKVYLTEQRVYICEDCK